MAGALIVLLMFAPAPVLSGTVRASNGVAVAGATVVAQHEGRTMTATTDEHGAFTLPELPLPATIDVHAAGFTSVRVTAAQSPINVTLAPTRVRESIVVTAGTPAAEWRRPATGTTVLTAAAMARVPAITMDETLRMVSGLSLFRRSSSRSSNPTTHGVTMRGLSASGASRGLVLFDGLPLNDGFGGWVTWTRIPVLATSHVAIDRGPEGATFGSDALGGVIDIAVHPGAPRQAASSVYAGTDGVAAFDVSAGGRPNGRVSWFGAASWFQTDGVVPVAPESAGAVDVRADAEWWSALARITVGGDRHRLTFGAWAGEDDRGNGTVLQRNRMSGGTGSVAYDGLMGTTSVAARVSMSPNRFRQTFSRVPAGRATETLTSTQFVSGSTLRGIVEAGRPIPRGYLTGRLLFNRASVEFEDLRAGGLTFRQLDDSGGAAAVHAAWHPAAALSLGAGLRREWRTAPALGGPRDAATVGHLSAAWQVSNLVTARGSVATSHRWPTLNELVRNFQVGSAVTLANEDLAPERARSVDAAIAVTRGRWQASAGGFWTSVDAAIANVTLQFTPTVIRQRQNTGTAKSRGLELDAEIRPWTFATLRASAVVVDARFRDSVEPVLEGKRLPQVPRSSVSVSGDVQIGPWLQAAGLYRWIAPQFDDDRNVFELAQASQFDLRLFGALGKIRQLTWHVTIENAADARIEVGRTPLVTLAPGRAFRAGLTWRR